MNLTTATNVHVGQMIRTGRRKNIMTVKGVDRCKNGKVSLTVLSRGRFSTLFLNAGELVEVR